MSKLRQNSLPPVRGTSGSSPVAPLRIVASGVVFLKHTIVLPLQSDSSGNTLLVPGSTSRAQNVIRHRGGAAAGVLSILSQFSGTQSWLVAPFGTGPEGEALKIELQREGISTELCARREADGVPRAFVILSNDNNDPDAQNTQTVINHNPIPEILHEEFFRLIGPLLYSSRTGISTPTTPTTPHTANLPPIDWFHFEGRDPSTTAANMRGIDQWLRERVWRDQAVLSLDMSKPGRQGSEQLIPHADVIFFSKAYAHSKSFTSPRSFLLSLRAHAPPHALLICSWGKEGGAILSVPTREYFQSSAFVPDPDEGARDTANDVGSIKTNDIARSSFGAPGDDDGDAYWDEDRQTAWARGVGHATNEEPEEEERLDETGSEDAFTAGIIFALSRRLLPGAPYAPSIDRDRNVSRSQQGSQFGSSGRRGALLSPQDSPSPLRAEPVYEGRWRLDECLRFATELAGRRMRRSGPNPNAGLAVSMEYAGWRM